MRDPSVPLVRTPPTGEAPAPDPRPAHWIDEEYTKTLVQSPPFAAAGASAAPAPTPVLQPRRRRPSWPRAKLRWPRRPRVPP